MRKSLSSRAAGFALALCSVVAGALLAVAPGIAQAEACPNAAFRTGPSAPLPDCRAYEMVSPSYTNEEVVGPEAIGLDGSSMSVSAFTGFSGLEGDEGILGGHYLLTRTESGWTATPRSLPSSQFTIAEWFAGNGVEPLETGAFIFFARAVSQPDNAIDIYERHGDGSIVDMGPAVPPSAPSGEPAEELHDVALAGAGVSDDGSHVFFTLQSQYWSIDGQHGRLFEYVGAGNSEPLLVGVDSSGHLISPCADELLGAGPGDNGEEGSSGSYIEASHNAVSADGNTVFFTAYPCSGGGGPPVPELFARIDNGQPDAHTVAISEPTEEDCSACDTESEVLAEAHFEGASEDGSKVFFETSQPLLGADTSINLYEYNFDAPAGERVTRITSGDSTVSDPTASIQGRVVQISEDGSHAYFVATGVLTLRPNGEGQQAQPGADNLYVVGPDPANPAQDRTAFIADLCSGLHESGAVSDGRCQSSPERQELGEISRNDKHLWAGYGQEGSDVTPNGRFLVFLSYGDLTPDDTSSAKQVFEYDAQQEKLVRVSIGQNGFNDNGNTVLGKGEKVNPGIVEPQFISAFSGVGANPAEYWSHLTVSADGSYVFFESPDGLTEGALNDAVIGEEFGELYYAKNIYEYRSLNGNIAEGNVYLISDGQDLHKAGEESAVHLIGTDASGQDVFFTTLDHLVGQDTSGHPSIFDARIDGGFPAPAAPPVCSGDACQGPLATSPTLLSPGSEFQAGGNPPLAASAPAVKAKPLTRAQKLTKALAACNKQPKKKRAACKRQARRKYQPVSKGKAKKAAARIGGRS
jgi:hypothetical protein